MERTLRQKDEQFGHINTANIKVVIASGFEPETLCLEGRCSIQLSYATTLL